MYPRMKTTSSKNRFKHHVSPFRLGQRFERRSASLRQPRSFGSDEVANPRNELHVSQVSHRAVNTKCGDFEFAGSQFGRAGGYDTEATLRKSSLGCVTDWQQETRGLFLFPLVSVGETRCFNL